VPLEIKMAAFPENGNGRWGGDVIEYKGLTGYRIDQIPVDVDHISDVN
jgi:hypothetical protein